MVNCPACKADVKDVASLRKHLRFCKKYKTGFSEAQLLSSHDDEEAPGGPSNLKSASARTGIGTGIRAAGKFAFKSIFSKKPKPVICQVMKSNIISTQS